jgi:hypothetical protein
VQKKKGSRTGKKKYNKYKKNPLEIKKWNVKKKEALAFFLYNNETINRKRI